MSLLLTTNSVAPNLRVEYWTDVVCETYVQLECEAAEPAAFGGSIRSHALPGLDVSVVQSRAQRVCRTAGLITRSSDDYFIVSIQRQGQGLIMQDGRQAALSPGDFAIYDSTRPYVLQFSDDFEEIVLRLRREQLGSLLRDTHLLTATPVSGRAGAGHLMMTMIQTLWDDIDALEPASAAAVANGVLNILVAGLQTLPASKSPGLSSLTTYHLARIKRLIDERLGDPALSAAAIAGELGLSISHLHRLFKSEALPPTQYIWNRRLEACSRDLLDPRRAGQSVSEIAFARGFSDAAHFSRSFRERFGCSPREWRHRP